MGSRGSVSSKSDIQTVVKTLSFSQLGQYFKDHRNELGISSSQDPYMVAFDVKSGKIPIVSGKIQFQNQQDNSNTNINIVAAPAPAKIDSNKYGPAVEDVGPGNYFSGTDVPVNISLKDWVKEADTKGVPNEVLRYMTNSSINQSLRNGSTNYSNVIDSFTRSSTVPSGSVLYSGLSSAQMENFWNQSSGTVIQYPAYLSTSPDPVYARGYASNTDVVLKITTTKRTSIGKTYYSGTNGTEGILGRNTRYTIGKQYYSRIQGDRVRIIEITI